MATGTMGQRAFMAHLKLPPLNSPGWFRSLERVPSGKMRKFLPDFTSSVTSWITLRDWRTSSRSMNFAFMIVKICFRKKMFFTSIFATTEKGRSLASMMESTSNSPW